MASYLDNEKWAFLNREFLTLSVSGALEHWDIYKSRTNHEKLREKLRDLLEEYARTYMTSEKPVSDEIHNRKIQGI